MISSLRGPVIDIGLNSAVVECGGVGYLFSATPQTLAELSRGEEATVLTLLIVREDSMSLYGFKDAASRDLFSTLLGVSGVQHRRLRAGCDSWRCQSPPTRSRRRQAWC